jgi:hypothetical protein
VSSVEMNEKRRVGSRVIETDLPRDEIRSQKVFTGDAPPPKSLKNLGVEVWKISLSSRQVDCPSSYRQALHVEGMVEG